MSVAKWQQTSGAKRRETDSPKRLEADSPKSKKQAESTKTGENRRKSAETIRLPLLDRCGPFPTVHLAVAM